MKKIFVILVTLALTVTGCQKTSELTTGEGYTYNDYLKTMPTNWNPHTYETSNDAYPSELLRMGLYKLYFNDEVYYISGKEPYESYVIAPEMASALPVDVTEEIKAEYPEFNIPSSANKGFAYKISLNRDAVWENGVVINADTYIYSMKRLLSPELLNYRAADYYSGSLRIAGAREYATSKNIESADFSKVGLLKTGEYEITIVLEKSMDIFSLAYNLTENFIVYEDLYEKCLKKEGNTWFSTYNTSTDTTMSYGPYRLAFYQKDKAMSFEKNPNFYGYSDGKHMFCMPETNEVFDMYMTTRINTQVVGESAGAKMMFLRGELSRYTLAAEDYDEYRKSTFAYETPGETVFFLILNKNREVIEKREAASDFDKSKYDLQMLLLKDFRKALAVTYDKELFAKTLSPARSAGFGLIGNSYIYSPEDLLFYRETDEAKRVLCNFYGVDISEFASLDDAIMSISGYLPTKAKELFNSAFNEALRLGYITDTDNNGISDQTVTIEYCMSSDSDFMTKTIDYLNKKAAEITIGTPFENKISFKKSAPYGNDWVSKIKSGISDVVLAGWSGSRLDPFSLTDLYVNPIYQYDAAWFDSKSTELTINIYDEDITMSLYNWSEALSGNTVYINDKQYNFGAGTADTEIRLKILASIEGTVLETYNYIPMLEDASVELLSKKVYYASNNYNEIIGWGGFAYLLYNYNDSQWADYVSGQNGTIKY